MSENNEWKKDKLSEEDLAKAAGGLVTIFLDFECKKCGRFQTIRSEEPSPWCCGQVMNHVNTIVGGVL